MKYNCDVIEDLLPLYADNACSEKSREIVEEHLQECPTCRNTASRLLNTGIEDTLLKEKTSVLEYGAREFRRRSAAVGTAVSGGLTIPVLLCIAFSLFARPSLSWVSLVLASMCVLASLIAVPLLVRKDKLFWTFCAFTASLLFLLGVTCMYTHGDWFPVSASAVLFGLSVIFLPFLLRARPVRRLIGSSNQVLIILGIDFALFFNLLNMISTQGKVTISKLFFMIGIAAGIVCVIYAIIQNRKTNTR